MRDSQPLPRDLRTTARWIATCALLLAGCLNPRPEELPSAQGVDGAGDPAFGGSNENATPDPRPVPAPASPGPADPSDEEPSQGATNGNPPAPELDGGTDADAAAPDAGD